MILFLLLFGKSNVLFHGAVIVIKLSSLNKVGLMKIMRGLKLSAANKMKLEAKLQTSM